MGVETPVDPNQPYLTQGIGYPLRPIDNVPPTNYPDIGGAIAEGLFMQWMGTWSQGLYYPKGAYVIDGLFAAVANKLTLEKPAPVPSAPATFSLPTPWAGAVTQTNTSVVVSGQTYTFTETGWIKQLRVQVSELTANTNYRIIALFTPPDGDPVSTIIEEPVLIEDDWSLVALLNRLVVAGTVLRLSIDALNSGADTNISGGWQYQGPTQGVAPLARNWTVDNQRVSFRIDKFDLDGTDRGTELEGVIPDTTISVVQTDDVGLNSSYRVRSVTDNGTYMTYVVVLQDESGGGPLAGAVCTLDIDVPIPLPTEYDEELLVWGAGDPSWATVEGFLEFDGVDQGVPVSNAYGIDIEFEPASISVDWDIVAYSG